MPGNIWIDVEDLFEYAKANPRPSGIQRLAFEIYSAMQDRYGESGRIRFVRHDPVRQSFRAVPWAAVASLFERLTQAGEPGPASPARPAGGIRPDPALRLMLRRLSHRLPPGLRSPLTRFVRLQAEAARAALEALGALARGIRRRLLGRWGSASVPLDADGPQESGGFAQTVAPGDAILVLGSPWFHPGYDAIIARHRAQYGVRFAMLVYDIIPLRRPEWCDRGLVRIFGAWFPSVLPLTDVVFAISRATALDVERYARDIGVRLNAPPQVLPIGTGFRAPPLAPGAAPAAPTSRMPPAGSYALIVSTIEARKNHVLLFRVWRRMVDEMPADAIPTLVFAGRVGWLIDDLMRQLDNTDFLGGKVLLIEDPSDAELEVLYRGCLFTLFPSLYEGWGLPVTESLAFGKPCLISDRTSLPEAGGTLARYFDPDNITEAYALIRATIEDRDGLRSWEATIARDFRPVPWAATVDGILDGMGITMPERAGPSAG